MSILVPPGTLLLARQDAAYLPGGKSNRVVVGVLALAFGFLGLHRFALGDILGGILYLAGTLILGRFICLAFLLIWALAVAEGVRFLTMTDQQFLEYAGRRKSKEQR